MLQNISKELDYNNAEEVRNKNDFAGYCGAGPFGWNCSGGKMVSAGVSTGGVHLFCDGYGC